MLKRSRMNETAMWLKWRHLDNPFWLFRQPYNGTQIFLWSFFIIFYPQCSVIKRRDCFHFRTSLQLFCLHKISFSLFRELFFAHSILCWKCWAWVLSNLDGDDDWIFSLILSLIFSHESSLSPKRSLQSLSKLFWRIFSYISCSW